MTREDVLRFIQGKIAELMDLPFPVTADAEIMDGLGLDSLDFASVVISCEQAMGATLNEEGIDWSSIKTVRNLADLLYEHVK